MTNEENKKLHERDEREFKELISKFGKAFASTKAQDIYDHYDLTCHIFLGSKPKKVDVKSVKRVNIEDKSPDDTIHWVEETNVNGNTGWLNGKANYFAFQTNKTWVIVEKTKLQKFIKERCPDKIIYSDKKLYKRYRRVNYKDPKKNRLDSIILVETSELIKLAEIIYNRDPNYIDINDVKLIVQVSETEEVIEQQIPDEIKNKIKVAIKKYNTEKFEQIEYVPYYLAGRLTPPVRTTEI